MSEKAKQIWGELAKIIVGAVLASVTTLVGASLAAGELIGELHENTRSIAKAHAEIERLDKEGTKSMQSHQSADAERRLSDERRMAALELSATYIPRIQTDVEWIRRTLESKK